MAAACRRHWGTVPADPAFADRAYDKGCRLFSLSTDLLAVRRGIDASNAMYQKFFS